MKPVGACQRCGERQVVLHELGVELVCAGCYRKQATRRAGAYCDDCGHVPAVFHPAKQSWLCRDCAPGVV